MRRWILGLVTTVAACASVLGLRDEVREATFPHRAHLLEGVSCFKCHRGLTQTEPTPRLHLPTADSCLECHAKPHRPEDCLSCHASPTGRSRATLTQSHLVFDHALHLPKVNLLCGRCHLDVPEDRTASPSMAGCLSCHEHREAYQDRTCGQCHRDLPAELARPDSHAVHGFDFSTRHAALRAPWPGTGCPEAAGRIRAEALETGPAASCKHRQAALGAIEA